MSQPEYMPYWSCCPVAIVSVFWSAPVNWPFTSLVMFGWMKSL